MEVLSKSSVKSKVLHTAIKMFLSSGYEKTTMREIAKEAEVNYGSLMFAFKNKESLVCELVGHVIDCQFDVISEALEGKTDDKVIEYAMETTLQLYLAESSEYMREMYVVSYSMENSSRVIFNNITKKLQSIFGSHLPDLEEKDFYELEIASAGIMRNFLMTKCDKYFTMDRKVKRFLETTFLVYRVSDEKINEAIEFVKGFDFNILVKETTERLLEYIESRI